MVELGGIEGPLCLGHSESNAIGLVLIDIGFDQHHHYCQQTAIAQQSH